MYHGSFLSEFCIIVKCQISKSLDKHHRKIFLADDPCRDWLFSYFDSKGPALWRSFSLYSKICHLTVLCARVRINHFFFVFQVNFVNRGSESA